MLTRLTCHVTNCASNQNNCCCQPSIKVQGKGACHCGETECQSFQKKGPGEVSNSTHFTNANLNAQQKTVYLTPWETVTQITSVSAEMALKAAARQIAKVFRQDKQKSRSNLLRDFLISLESLLYGQRREHPPILHQHHAGCAHIRSWLNRS